MENNDDPNKAVEISDMVLKNNIINACAHGPLSNDTPAVTSNADTDYSRHIIIDNCENGVIEYEVTEYRDADSDDTISSDSSSDSSSDVNSVKDVEELSSSDEEDSLECNWGTSGVRGPPKVRGELGLDELPPIEELTITVPSNQCTTIGKVYNIVDKLVIVQANPETPVVDLESVLFLDKGARALGKVYDVFGPVTEAYYCVRFNSADHIKESNVEKGMEVFFAPKTDHTNFVFVTELMKIKGSDASWLNDVEPPPNQVEYSDDEEERRVNKARKEHKQENKCESKDGEASRVNRRPKPTKFEEQMNRRNLQRTAEANSRFGGPSNRFRNPFTSDPRRGFVTPFGRFGRPWGPADCYNPQNVLQQAPAAFPPLPSPVMRGVPPPVPPFNLHMAPVFAQPPPGFNPGTPPPFMGNRNPNRSFQFGRSPRMNYVAPGMGRGVPPFRQPYAGAPPPWFNNAPPPPPGT